jgi:hypothetical protein
MTKLNLETALKYKYDLTEEKEFKRSNIFNGKPKGVIIFDSYNNPFFPLKQIDLDDTKLSLPQIKQELKQKNYNGNFLPWHYWVEFVNNDYIVVQGRPLNYMTPLVGYNDYLSICIAGNSKHDIYLKKLYHIIADITMNSLHYLPSWKLNLIDETYLINLGKSFDEHQLIKHLK